MAKLPNADHRLQDVAFSPDGRLLAAGYGFFNDGGVTVWDVEARKAVAALLGGSRDAAGVKRVAFSPDGRLFAAASDRGHLMLWTVGAWRSHKTLRAAEADTSDLVFSPDSTKLALATEEAALLYDLRTGRETVVTKKTERDEINGVSFTPDGRHVVAFDERSIRVWDVAGRKTVNVIGGAAGSFFGRLSPDGRRTVSGGGGIFGGKAVEVRTFPEGQKLHGLSEFRNGLFAVAVANSGRLFALAGGDYGDGGALSLWDMDDAREIGYASFGGVPIQGVAFSPDDKLLAAASYDGFVLLYSVERLRGPELPFVESLLGAGTARAPVNVAGRKKLSP
jgi:WD40 repeat protein